MSDSYQAIYDAVRSCVSGGDIGAAVAEQARQSFDISFAVDIVKQELIYSAAQNARPSVVYRPTLSADGTKWCALLGDNLQEGVAGFGDTPAEAMLAFDEAFYNERPPAALSTLRKDEDERA